MNRTFHKPAVLIHLSILAAVLLLATIIPASADLRLSYVYSAYPGGAQGNIRNWAGYASAPSDTPAYAGALTIDPGGPDWPNYVSAAQASVPYTITSITLNKQAQEYVQCSGTFPTGTITQTGSENIRLNWPLLYEVPNTRWTLTINYETPTPWNDGSGQNQPSTTHTDTWIWILDTDIQHVGYLLSLLHDIEVGTSGVGTVNDEVLYATLANMLEHAFDCYENYNDGQMAEWLTEFELEVMDACTSTLPEFPNPTGPGTGIINTLENPACCRLLIDVEHIMLNVGIGSTPSPPPTLPAISKPAISIASTLVQSSSPKRVYASHRGNSAGNPTIDHGFLGTSSGQVAMPGVLGIVPGTNWSNFVYAAQKGVYYTIRNVTLTRERPAQTVCGSTFPSSIITQEGTPNIRLWWPLMYEPAGTQWALTILYGTSTLFDDDGDHGPNPPSWMHVETWKWRLREDVTRFSSQLDLFHRLPFGTSGVPLISDEPLYNQLNNSLSDSVSCLSAGNIPGLQAHTEGFKLALADACITTAPSSPIPAGPGTGITCTQENPACSRLQSYAQSLQTSGAAGIADAAKTSQDNTAVAITQPQTATLITQDWFYVQDQDRSSGLRVVGSIGGLQPGGQVLLRGIMGTNGPERVMNLIGYEVMNPSGPLPRSLAMPARNIGGSGSGLVPGFENITGLWNGGLRVTVTGRVKTTASDHCYIDDGSGIINGMTNTGLRITLLPGIIPPTTGSYIRATGISSWSCVPGQPQPAVLVSTSTDLTTIQAY